MTFKGPGGFGRIVNCIMHVIMCAILSFYVLWTVQHIPGNEALPILTPLGFFVSLVESFCVGMFIGDFVFFVKMLRQLREDMPAFSRL